jgi:two-component system CheB/CheR fusion protein
MEESPLRGRTILVIEDDDDHREVIQRLLESLGARVMVAADGLEGLGELARRRADAIFCDLTMPIMDGIEFANRVRQLPRYRRVLLVAVTGRDAQADIFRTWHAGFDAHLVKPITLDALRAIARRLSDQSGAGAASSA